MKTNKLLNYYTLVQKMILYNLRIIFANKFIWFLAGSIIFYLGLSVIYVFSEDISRMQDLYGVFMFSGVLLVFYPSVFGIQNDQDARTIEILFGIPNYRYKVWLVRIILIFVIAYLIMLVFTFLSSDSDSEIPDSQNDDTGYDPCPLPGNDGFHALNGYQKRKWYCSGDDHLRTFLPDPWGSSLQKPVECFSQSLLSCLWRERDNLGNNHVQEQANTHHRIDLFLLAALLNLQKREKFM